MTIGMAQADLQALLVQFTSRGALFELLKLLDGLRNVESHYLQI